MATVARRICDSCGSDEKVEELIVVFAYGKARPWGVDCCAKCYQSRFADLIPKGRNPTRSNIRPQHKFVKTNINQECL